jgi:hypothetical protein
MTEKINTGITLAPELFQGLKAYQRQNPDLSRNVIINIAIREFLEDRGVKL